MYRDSIFALFLSLVAGSSISAECDVRAAVDAERLRIIERGGEAAREKLPLLKQLSQINDKAKDPKLPLSEQLAPRDAAQFAEISQRLAAMDLSEFIDSNRERDLGAIVDMLEAAEQIYLGRSAEVAVGENVSRMLLIAMRAAFPRASADLTDDRPVDCSVGSALIRAELEAVSRTSAFFERATAAQKRIVALRVKYAVREGAQLDRKILSPEDRKILDETQRAFDPIRRELEYLSDIENIRFFHTAAELVYSTRRQDVLTYGASMNAIGRTLEKRRGELDERTQAMIGFWVKLNEKVPSEFIRLRAQIARDVPTASK